MAFTGGLQATFHSLDAHVGVVHINPGSQVLAGFPLPQEVLDKFNAVLEVVPTAAPLPRLFILQVRGLVTGAALHAA